MALSNLVQKNRPIFFTNGKVFEPRPKNIRRFFLEEVRHGKIAEEPPSFRTTESFSTPKQLCLHHPNTVAHL